MPGIGSRPDPKPAKGSYRLELIERKRRRRKMEDEQKQQVRNRDGYRCRYPGCTFQNQGFRFEVAHLDDKGMGGDPSLIRTERRKMIGLCHLHHQGTVAVTYSLHGKTLRIEPETDRGTDGLCKFSVAKESGWEVVGFA